MPEILTESFCERCGTRYTFESSAPRTARLKGVRVLSKGLKNYVLSDDTSMDEAMAAARSETDREATSQQLDAFHKTFNFCMSCRQYTCANCWNEAEGRCLSCAPHLGREILPAPFPDLDPHGGLALHGHEATNGTTGPEAADAAMAAMAWPTSDLMRDADDDLAAPDGDFEPPEPIDAAARLAALSGAPIDEAPAGDAVVPALEAEADREPDAATATPAEPELVAAPEAIAGPDAASASGVGAIDAADVEGRASAAADQTTDLFRRFRPGQSLDAEIEAFEREQQAAALAAASTPAPEPSEAEPLDGAAPTEPMAVDAVAPVAPEPIAMDEPAAPEPVAEPSAPEPIAASAARDDVVEQPTWRIVAPDEADEPAAPTTPPAPTSEPQWPASPEWPSQRPAGGLPFLGRPPEAGGGIEALWAESAREVAAGPGPAKAQAGVQPCVSCGLSLSSTARFCRRCGSRQG